MSNFNSLLLVVGMMLLLDDLTTKNRPLSVPLLTTDKGYKLHRASQPRLQAICLLQNLTARSSHLLASGSLRSALQGSVRLVCLSSTCNDVAAAWDLSALSVCMVLLHWPPPALRACARHVILQDFK